MRRWYAVAVGGLGWSPRAFWKATISEFFMAVEGHNESQSATGGKPPPLSVAEQEELLAWDRDRKLNKDG